ncbi:collagen-binding domain-containing protein [Aquimarina litoralis]|uniref:collagen-binding domain-containing protein n=1 Tax=Aquimarina litoralis TaxID=584605 RepID=UPI001C58E27F|nr:collagen-binding domain-containing protein [Aquimarina litoralis]
MSKFTNKFNSLRQKMGFSLFSVAMIVIFIMTSGFNTVAEKGKSNFTSTPVCENPLTNALGYNAFVRYNTILKGGDTEGPIALGGNLTMEGIITVAAQTAGSNFFNGDDQPSSLVVNGRIIYTSGEGIHLNQGYVKVGDLNGSSVFDLDRNNASVNTRVTSGSYDAKPRVQVQRKQVEGSVGNGNLIDFEAAFTEFEAVSANYSTTAPNLTVSSDNKISLTQNTVNVLNLTGTELQALPYLTFENAPSQDTPLIINVDAPGSFEWNILNLAGIGDPQGAFIIWNFYNNTSLTLKGGSTIVGSLFAPKSDVTKDSSGNINGQVIAANYYHVQGELHQHVFDACTDNDICELTVDAGEDSEFCGEGEVTLTATVGGASECEDCIGTYDVANTNNCRRDQDYVMWLTDGNNPRWFSNVDLEWIELADGTATLTGTIFDHTLTQTTYEVNAVFSGRTSTTPANSPKAHVCNDEDENGWIYYTGLTGTVTSTDGSWSINLSRRGPAFQMGNGANQTETELGKFGACGWFDTTDGQYNRGDFNFNLGDCVTTTNTEVSYLWSTGETTPSITVNEGGTYTVTVKDCEDCEASDSVEVVINDAPQVEAGEDQEICLGDEVTLTATTNNNESCESCIEYGVQDTDYCRGDQNYVLWLDGGRFFSNVDLEWNELADGTATLKGTVFDYTITQSNYEVDVVFTGKVTTAPANSPKSHICNDEDESGWEYYTEFTGTIISEDGSWSTTLTRRGPAFQMGNGANQTETELGKFGACGWFDTDNNEYPVGDFNFNFGDCISSETNDTTFLWSTGETTESITVSPEEDTVYTVTVTNCNGCTATDEVKVIVKSAVVDAGDDQNVCLGEEVTLTATGEGTFIWSTGETTESITVSPTETTTYTVTATSGSCEATDSVTVVVNDPVIVDAGEDQEICLGEEVTLTAQATGIDNCGDCVEFGIKDTDYCRGRHHQFVVFINDNGTRLWFRNVDLVWSENAIDGTATLKGEVFEYNSTNTSFMVDATFTGFTDVPPAGSPKASSCQTEDPTGWIYYTGISGTITQIDGALSYDISRRGEAFQVGNGANVFEYTPAVYGGSGWFNLEGNPDSFGDFNINIGDCISQEEGQVQYLWSTGETTQSITVSPEEDTTYTVTVTGCTECVGEDEVTVIVNSATADAVEDQDICVGETATLTVVGTGDILWSTGETTASIEVSPDTTTTYTVEVTNGDCSATDEVTVTVNSATADAGEDQDICVGETATLTVVGTGDILWSTGETTTSIEVSPDTTTTYTVEVTNGDCSATDEVTVTVNSATADAGEDQDICVGETAILTVVGTGDILWSTGETTASIEVSPDTTTTYTVEVTNGDCSATDEVTVTVNSATADAGEDQDICVGETTTLTVVGTGDILWSTGETTASIEVSPDATTTYTVEVTNGNCSATDEVTVTVNSVTADAGEDQTIAPGETATLTATGGDTYLWSTGETTATIDVSPDATTTYTVTASSNGCTATDDVTVFVEGCTVVADAGPDQTICNVSDSNPTEINSDGIAKSMMESVVLTATGGDTYLWSTGETTQSIIVEPTVTTTYTVEVTKDGCTDSDDVTVFVVDIDANAGIDVESTAGALVVLTATGGDTYLWSTGETTQSITVAPTVTTTYSVTAFRGECSDTDSVRVLIGCVGTADAGPDQTICLGESAVLTASDGDIFLWSSPSGSAGNTQSVTVTPTVTTTYILTIIRNGCLDRDEVTVFVDDCGGGLGLGGSPTSVNALYPTVVSSTDKVSLDMFTTRDKDDVQVTFYSLSGRFMSKTTVMNIQKGKNTLEVDLSTVGTLSAGMYLVKISNAEGEIMKKIVVK